MILSGKEIKRQLGRSIIISPFKPENLGKNSYDLTLDDKLLIYEDAVLDMKRKPVTREIKIPENGLVLQPHEFYLGCTVEWTHTKDFVPQIDGRSSVGRYGISVHQTAGFGDVGYQGRWTLEISVQKTTVIYPFLPFCQIYFFKIEGEYEQYEGRYQNSKGIVASRFCEDYEDEQKTP